jgi:hypothetical protein
VEADQGGDCLAGGLQVALRSLFSSVIFHIFPDLLLVFWQHMTHHLGEDT